MLKFIPCPRPTARVWAVAFALAGLQLLAAADAHEGDPTARAPAVWPAPGSRPGDVGFCVVNVGLSSVFMGKAGLAINAAVKTCQRRSAKHPISMAPATRSQEERATCSASVTGIITSFAYVSTFASAAAADCLTTLTFVDVRAIQRAACAADTSAVLAGLGLIANAGSGVATSCAQETPLTPAELLTLGAPDRRLGELQTAGLASEQERALADLGRNHTEILRRLSRATRTLLHAPLFLPRPIKAMHEAIHTKTPPPASQAECAFNVGQSTFFFARAGLLLNAAIQDCSAMALFQGGDKKKAKCTAEITRLILSLGVTGSGIANAVVQCPALLKNVKAACAGAIINIIAGFSDVLAASASFANSCAALQSRRRLTDTNESSASEYLV